MHHDPKVLLKIRAVADRTSSHPRSVYRWIAEGRLPAVRIGGGLRVPAAALDEIMGGTAANALGQLPSEMKKKLK